MNATLTEYRPQKLRCMSDPSHDRAFIAFASPENRCLGIVKLFEGYKPRKICLLRIADEPNRDREENIAEFRRIVSDTAPIEEIQVKHSDVISGIDHLIASVLNAHDAGGDITVDISTFPKPSLLLTLRALTRQPQIKRMRVVYSEPDTYKQWLKEPLTYGIKKVAVIPTFTAPYRANQDLILIVFLGYERDRTLGLWQSIEPNKTIAVIARPAYRKEWEGQTEVLNAALLAGLGDESVFYVDPRNTVDTYRLLCDIINPGSEPGANYYIAPLGTKPQTLGVHYFCSRFPDAATVIHASPMEHGSEYISQGVGPSWELPAPEGCK